MNLLVVYITSVVIGQSIAVGFGLLVERMYTPYIGLVAFFPVFFAMFWLAWRVAVRVTKP